MLRISHGHEDKTNGCYGSRSPSRHRLDISDLIKDGMLLDTLDRRGNEYKYYSSSSSSRHYGRHHYHPYMANERGYFPYELKKEKPPTFDGDVKKLRDGRLDAGYVSFIVFCLRQSSFDLVFWCQFCICFSVCSSIIFDDVWYIYICI